jgi:hypothetical protein
MTGFVAFLIKIGFEGLAGRAIDVLEARAQLANESEALRARTTVELARQAVNEAKILADLNRAKFAFPWFWMFAGMFILPLALWWAAVILDSVFMFSWNVADLPTPQMQEWAGNMIQWVFYVGSGVGVLKAVGR